MKTIRSSQKLTGVDLLNGPVMKTLLTFSFPFMLSTLLQTCYSTADTVIVGQYLGKVGLSAVSNGSQLMHLADLVCIGFASAGQVLIAQAEGAGNRDKTMRIIGTMFRVLMVSGVFIGSFFAVFSKPLLSLIKTPAEAFAQAHSYVLICSAGILCTLLYNMVSAIMRGLGDSKHPLLFVLIASLINIVLDILFVSVFDFGVAGTAWATIIGQACSVLFSISFLIHHRETFGLHFSANIMRPDSETTSQILKIGIPLAFQNSAIQFSFLFVSTMINTLGVSVSAAFGVTQKLRSIPGVLTQGIGLGATCMLGQNLGARKLARVQKIIRSTIVFTTTVSIISMSLFWAAPTLSFQLFTQDSDVLSFASICVSSIIVEMPARFVMPASNALISAQGKSRLSLLFGLLDAFVGRVLCCWLLGIAAGLELFGFLLGYCIGTYLTAIPAFLYYLFGFWKKQSVLINKQK